jgi:hypothetical protein
MSSANARLEIEMPSGMCRFTVVDVERQGDGSSKVTVAGDDQLDMLSHVAIWVEGEQQTKGTFAPYQVDSSTDPTQYVGVWTAQAA